VRTAAYCVLRAVCSVAFVLVVAPPAAAQSTPELTEASVAAFVRAMGPVSAEMQRLWGLRRDVTRDIAVQRGDSVRECRDPKREQELLKPGTAMGMPIDEYTKLMEAAVRGDAAARRKVDSIGKLMTAASKSVTSRSSDCERTTPPQEFFVRRREASRAELERLGWRAPDSYGTMRTTGRAVYFAARLDSIALANAGGMMSATELRSIHERLRSALGDLSTNSLSAAERAVVARHREALERIMEGLSK